MAISFPSNPSDNQKYTYNGKSYVYVAARGVWINAGTSTNIVVPASGTETQFTATTLLPASSEGTNLGTAAQPFGELYLSANSIYLGSTVLNASKVLNVDTNVTPETLALQVQSDGAGHAPAWEWTWEQSALPFARLAITNSPQSTVPLYQQGTYQINNFANTQYGSMTQTHAFKLKWIESAGDDNLVDWVTTTEVTHSHPDINGGADTTVQRLSFTVPETITLPTLTAPSVTYTVSNNGAGAYTFSGTATGDNPNIGPFYRGGTYTINITATGHPFYFTTDNGTGFVAGSYIGEYTSGVTGSRTESGTITFVVPSDAPDTLYYQCGNHSVMRGSITVKDLEVETNENGNYIIYGQHSQEQHAQKIEIRPLPELSSQMCIVYDGVTGKWQPQDLATYVENTPSFENKIKEVAGTATLVAPDGTSLVASVEIYTTDSYLPQLGNTNGDIAFVEDTQELKIWKTGSGWLDVTAASTGGGGGGAGSPTITGVTPASYDGADATTFTITGTNFDLGTVVDFITSSGTTVRASTTTVVDQANLTALTPQAFQEADGPLDVKITTNAGSTVTAPDMIQTGGSPVWTTAAGTLYQNAWPDDVASGDNSYRLEMDVDETVVATDPDSQPITYTLSSGSLPPNVTLNQLTGAITGTLPGTGVLTGDTTYTFTISANDSSGNATLRTFSINVKNQIGTPVSAHVYITPGTYSWTCPTNVTSVAVVCIGGGGGGDNYFGTGGTGGGLGWKNNIAVTPGASYTVVVGAGGAGDSSGTSDNDQGGAAGGDSYFISNSTVAGFGGPAGIPHGTGTNNTQGGGYAGDGGGNGGYGLRYASSGTTPSYISSGGGGAGGYSGNGGNGGGADTGNGAYVDATDGAGGGGGGGAGMYTNTGTSSDVWSGGSGGGVGIYGQGASGLGGTQGTTSGTGTGGGGGSGGANGSNASQTYGTSAAPAGGAYGGGGAGNHGDGAGDGGNGAGGAVRIVWGPNRSFPSTNVDLASSTTTETTT